jgi:hypothetical protein
MLVSEPDLWNLAIYPDQILASAMNVILEIQQIPGINTMKGGT